MKICKTINSLKQRLKTQNDLIIGFVPTMGYLHEGHLSLIRRSVKECDLTVVSIYVNPTQFGPQEDLDKYPRDFKRDRQLLKEAEVDVVFYPDNQVMYPSGYSTYVTVEGLTDRLCGAVRPGHFRGVTTIVTKLLHIVEPHVMYLGQKDLQQARVIERMIKDLNMDVKICVCPTVREQDGLAMSSRNRYLSAQQRREAPVLYQSLKEAKHLILDGEKSAARLKKTIKQLIAEKTNSKIDYIEVGDAKTLASVDKINQSVYIAAALYLGKARLIDNVIVRLYGSTQKKKN